MSKSRWDDEVVANKAFTDKDKAQEYADKCDKESKNTVYRLQYNSITLVNE